MRIWKLAVLTTCLLTHLTSAGVAGAKEPQIDVQDAGAKADGIANVSPRLQTLIDSDRSGTFYFAPGVYRLHNPDVKHPGLVLQGFSGSIIMAKRAKFACDTGNVHAGQCIWIKDSRGALFRNLTITYANPELLPMKRIVATGNALLVERVNNLKFLDTTIRGSTGSGIWNTNSTGITYGGITEISNTTADGIHFEDVGSSSVENLTTDNTGDDAIGVTNIAMASPNCGLRIERARISNSRSRGIAVAGGCNADFANIEIDSTANSAIAAVDDAAIQTRRSAHIRFTDVQATRVGILKSSVGGNGHCIDIGKADDVTVSRLTCSDSREDGVFVYDGANHVVIEKVVLRDTGNNGFQSSNASNVSFLEDLTISSANNGFDIEASSDVTLRDCKTERAGGYGFYHSGSSNINESGLVSRDSAGRTGNHRAWWAENMSGAIVVSGLSVIDDQAKPTGYIVGDDNLSGNQLDVKGIVFQIARGKGSIERHEGTAQYSMSSNAGPPK